LARGLAEALGGLAPGLRSSYATAAEYALQCAEPHEELARWFQRHLEGVSACVLLEDVHHAGSGTHACRLLESLIEYTPQLRWVLTTRTPLDLPLESWRAQGMASEPVSTEDLRLTEIEAMELARRCSFPSNLVKTLFDETMGWPLAFHIGTSLPEDIPELAALRPRTPDDAYDFLVRRLFQRYDPALQSVLLETSVFNAIDRNLLCAGPWCESWDRLAALARNGSLLSVPREDTLRYHDLFRKFLNAELRARGAWESALQTGAAALERSDRIPDALRLYVHANSMDNVLRLCETHGFELMEMGRRDEVVEALAVVEDPEQRESAVLLALRAINESLLGRNDTAEAWFLHAIEKAPRTETRAQIAYRYALDLIRHGRLEAISLLEPYVANEDQPEKLRALMQATLATAYVLTERFDEATQSMERALTLVRTNDSVPLQAKIHHQAAWVALFTGNVENAKAHAGVSVDLALQSGMYDTAARAYSVFYNVAYDVEDSPAEAMRILDRVLDCGLKAGSPQLRLFALLGMLDIAAELGDNDEVDRIAQTLSAHEVDFSDAAASEMLLPAQALRRAGQGHFAEAYRLLVASGERQITPDRRALRFSEIALYAAAANMHAAAQRALEEVLPHLDSLEAAMRRTVRTQLNCVLALRLLGDAERARALAETTTLRDNDRLYAFKSAVEAILRRWDGESNVADLAFALETLHAQHFGGLANVLASLPNAPRKTNAIMGVQ
jgi:tetratricopeptide (TPR) repeat protein